MESGNPKFPVGKLDIKGSFTGRNDLVRAIQIIVLAFCISTFVRDDDTMQEPSDVPLATEDTVRAPNNVPPENAEGINNRQEAMANNYDLNYMDPYNFFNGSICDLPLVRGPGDLSITRWGFRRDISACVRFAFSGRGGNENNFISRRECESVCFDYI